MYVFIILVVGCENCFYLVDTNSVNVKGTFNYTDIFMSLGILWGLCIMLKYKKCSSPKYRFKYFVIFVVVMAIISSFRSEVLYGQPFYLGLRPQRFWIVWSLLYFPLSKLMHLKVITYNNLEKMFYALGTIELVIYYLQYILADQIVFLHVSQGLRYGDPRFYYEVVLLNILLFICLCNLFNKKAHLKNTLYVIAILLFNMMVSKMRLTSLALVLSICFGIIIWRKARGLKFVYILLAIVVGVFISNLPIIKDTVSALMGGDKNLNIRDVGRQLYFSQLSLSPLLGRGYINELNYAAKSTAGFNQNIYLVDNGIFAFAYMYGLIGIGWFLLLWQKLYTMALRVLIKANIYVFLLFMLYITIVLQNELQWYWGNRSILFIIFICMLEARYRTTLDEESAKS